jgi:hypothetical protein
MSMAAIEWERNEWIEGKGGDTSIDEFRRRSIIKVEEKGKSYHGNNKRHLCFYTYRVDGGLIKGNAQVKCDFLFFDEHVSNVFFIELKGKNIPHAFEQLTGAVQTLLPVIAVKAGHSNSRIHGRIVCSGFPSAVYNAPSTKKYKDDFKKKYNTKLIIKELKLSEDLTQFYA